LGREQWRGGPTNVDLNMECEDQGGICSPNFPFVSQKDHEIRTYIKGKYGEIVPFLWSLLLFFGKFHFRSSAEPF
jgi:hypothetical protein